jgi:hypothetical protein
VRCHTLSTSGPAPPVLVARSFLETFPPGEGIFWLVGAAFADVARLGECQPGLWWSERLVACGTLGDVSRCWVAPGGVACTRFAAEPGPCDGLRDGGPDCSTGRAPAIGKIAALRGVSRLR